MAEKQFKLKFDGANAKAVDEYLEYSRIVGEDDGGELFTPEQYEEYKKKVLPMRIKNRLYTCWTGPTGMDCKLVGPETPCFCKHRYKQHKTDFEVIPTDRPILLPCKQKGCKCVSYHYVPMNGSQPIRCTCKHTSEEHFEFEPFICKRTQTGGGCTKCAGFKSSFTCGCGAPVKDHTMIVETAEEREARGHPLGESTPYAAMGGITGFSSMADGYMRLDPSGKGAPNKGYLEQSITSSDNPFLRANVQAIKAHQMRKEGKGLTNPDDEMFDDITERVSQMRRPGEDDMSYYERRYQERRQVVPSGAQGLDNGALRPGSRKAIEQKPGSGRRPASKK